MQKLKRTHFIGMCAVHSLSKYCSRIAHLHTSHLHWSLDNSVPAYLKVVERKSLNSHSQHIYMVSVLLQTPISHSRVPAQKANLECISVWTFYPFFAISEETLWESWIGWSETGALLFSYTYMVWYIYYSEFFCQICVGHPGSAFQKCLTYWKKFHSSTLQR